MRAFENNEKILGWCEIIDVTKLTNYTKIMHNMKTFENKIINIY